MIRRGRVIQKSNGDGARIFFDKLQSYNRARDNQIFFELLDGVQEYWTYGDRESRDQDLEELDLFFESLDNPPSESD